MARALVELIGDSASAVRALDQTSAAAAGTGDAFKALATEAEAAAAAITRASATRAESLLAQSAALRQTAASSAGTVEGAVAGEAAVRRQTQAYRLLGIQAAQTNDSLTRTAGTVGRGLTTYVTAPAAFVTYEAVKQAMDYQQAILLIRTQAGASAAELNNMNSSVLNLVQSGKSYGQTAQEMAQSLFYVESEGIRGERALATIQAAAAGAAKGQTDMADTTNALTSAMKIWNVPASDAARTMATIDAVTATGKMHLQDLNEAFGTRFFTTAQAIGVPLEQAGALLDVFTKMGVPAARAATNLTTTFIRLVDPAKGAATALQQLGLTQQQLGRDLQSGGITKALADLTAGYDRLVQEKGPAAGEAAVFGAFGGSHGGGSALQAIQGYQSYLQSLGEVQRLNNPATFWSQVSEAMHSPAMQVKQDVAEIGADFIKLGTALAPTVVTIADGVAEITTAFGHLPGVVKDAIGVTVGVLAVGGPLGLAVKGVGTLVTGVSRLFRLLGPSAAAGAAEADASIATMGTTAATAEGEVGGLRAALLGLGGPEVLAALAAAASGLAYFEFLKSHEAYKGGPGQGLVQPRKGGPIQEFGVSRGGAVQGVLTGQAAADARRRLGDHPNTAAERARAQAEDAYYRHHRRQSPHHPASLPHLSAPHAQTGPTSFTLPQNLQLELARAQAGFGNLHSAEEDERAYILRQIRSGDLHGKALVQAYNDLASVNDELASQVKKANTAATKAKQDAGQFTLPPSLQLAQARADALAALTGGSGPTALQVSVARREKAAAERALKRHNQTVQAMIDEWDAIDQANSVLAQMIGGGADLYHAASTGALTKGLGLGHTADLTLRERLAQAEAHRGHVPNQGYQGDGTIVGNKLAQAEAQLLQRVHTLYAHHDLGRGQERQMIVQIENINGVKDINKLKAELDKIARAHHKRAGSRR